MKREAFTDRRVLNRIDLEADLVVAGGGLSGVCTAITAARAGVKVILVQDRPVLGGNCSSEIRLWILGATSHMGNNNRWSREGGVIDEILVENTYRNAEGNPVILDMILLEKVANESNITLLLNTAVYEVGKSDSDTITFLKAFCSQSSIEYRLRASLFCDASGDGIVGFLAGAAFRMGAERREEFGEKMAPSSDYGELLGHSLYFYSKDTGKSVKFIPPSFALTDITKIPRYRSFNAQEHGCKLWWVEYGGRLDTVHDTEKIKWELWKVVYGVWNYIKNSGNFPEAETFTLEWVGAIPGKRESRRFEGDYILTQQDLVEQHRHEDAVAYGGWSIDLHPADGVFSEKPGCNQWHSKGIFQIPYRCLYSNNINNLFLAGRIISVSHVAFGATRVMATSAYVGQAVGMAAKICLQNRLGPRGILTNGLITTLQQELMKNGQFIPGCILNDEHDLMQQAKVSSSRPFPFKGFQKGGKWKNLDIGSGQIFPHLAGRITVFKFRAASMQDTILETELRISSRKGNFTPDVVLATRQYQLKAGEHELSVDFDIVLKEDCYVFILFKKNVSIRLAYTEERVTGVLSIFNLVNKAVSNYGKQIPPKDSGVDEFEFWCPKRRPEGQNLAIEMLTEQNVFSAANVTNGIDRPFNQPNAWVANPDDQAPVLIIEWDEVKEIRVIDLFFDTDYDHPMETVLMTHPENVMPFCVRNYKIKDERGDVIVLKNNNFSTRNKIVLPETIKTRKLFIETQHPSECVPAAIFAVRCYSNANL